MVAQTDLAERANIVIVGGDIVRPSPDEQSTIELVRHARHSASGLVSLTGHLPPSAVSDLMAYVAAHGGVYVCASDKEEFGLAIVEALARGRWSSPPSSGPASYVDDGDTGVLCDTRSPEQLGSAIVAALARATDLGRAERSRAMVGNNLSVDRMAQRLVEVYRRPRAEHGERVKLLVISPDYASHAGPMIQVATAWMRTGGEAVVATGGSTRPMVEQAGLPWISLRLGKGSNAGIIEVDEQPAGEDEHLRARSSRRLGAVPVATLLYQADARRHDLLHEPERVLDRLADIVRKVQPDRVMVDHVAFGARLALRALGIEPASIVLGHPSALTAPGEVYGLPPEWPAAMGPNEAALDLLTTRCRASVDELCGATSDLLRRRGPGVPYHFDPTSTPGQPTIYVYPEALHDPWRPLPPNHVFVGSLARDERLTDEHLPAGAGRRFSWRSVRS